MEEESGFEKTTRRTFLAHIAGTAVATYIPEITSLLPQHTQEQHSAIVLEDSKLQVNFDKDSGALTELLWKPSA